MPNGLLGDRVRLPIQVTLIYQILSWKWVNIFSSRRYTVYIPFTSVMWTKRCQAGCVDWIGTQNPSLKMRTFLRIRCQYDLTLNAIQFITEGSRKCHTFKYSHYNIVQECDVHETANKLDRMMEMLQAGKECFITSNNTVGLFQIFIDWAKRPFTPRSGFIDREPVS